MSKVRHTNVENPSVLAVLFISLYWGMYGITPPKMMKKDATKVTKLTRDSSGSAMSPSRSFRNWYMMRLSWLLFVKIISCAARSKHSSWKRKYCNKINKWIRKAQISPLAIQGGKVLGTCLLSRSNFFHFHAVLGQIISWSYLSSINHEPLTLTMRHDGQKKEK